MEWLFVIGGIFALLTIHDIWTGEYSMVRFLLEVIIVYGVVLLGGIIWFVYDNNVIGPIAFLIGLAGGLGFRQQIIDKIEKLIPPTYDKMDIDGAIRHFKKHKTNLSNVIKYLSERRNLKHETITQYLLKHYTPEEINKQLK